MTSRTPASRSILIAAVPAAPLPEITICKSSSRLPTTRAALMSAARMTTAVPCWSSCMTGMSSASIKRSSISKQRGALMSSRLMPPKTGAMRTTVSTISSTSLVSRQIGKASMSPNWRKSIALPSITGSAASGPMSPEAQDSRAVGDDGDRVALDRQLERLARVCGNRHRDARDAGRVDHREILPVFYREFRRDANLAAEVREKGRIGETDDASAVDRFDRGAYVVADAIGRQR